jgi:hypothetical protein
MLPAQLEILRPLSIVIWQISRDTSNFEKGGTFHISLGRKKVMLSTANYPAHTQAMIVAKRVATAGNERKTLLEIVTLVITGYF